MRNCCHGVTYRLGQSIYIALTCRSNSATLPETRGASFTLPAEVISALQTLRRRELKDAKPDILLSTHQSDNLKVSIFLPPLPKISSVSKDEECDDCSQYYLSEIVREEHLLSQIESVVFAGEGEPTLRLPLLLSISRAVHDERIYLPIRVTTNGLIHSSVLHQMKEAGVTGLSIALITACQDQYVKLMNPIININTNELMNVHPHDVVCQFVQSAVTLGFHVEVTGVDRPEVNKYKAEELAKRLGVVTPFRWRSYFP